MYFSINKLSAKEVTVPVLVGAVSFVAGFYVGLRFKNKKDLIIETVEEAEQMSLFDDFESYEEDDSVVIHMSEYKPDPEISNVFEEYKTGWDWDIETMQREDNNIYVIHYDEFVNNESNYTQETLTYYSGDDILTDQMNTPIYDYQKMTGELRFGHGSKDENVVFIRNDEIHMEWEILREEGKYQIEVLGYDIEQEYEDSDLKHSNNYKFREE